MKAPADDLARAFFAMPPELRLWMLITGAGLACGALTESDVSEAAAVSPDPLERCKYMQEHLSERQTAMIRAEFAKIPTPVFGREGHA